MAAAGYRAAAGDLCLSRAALAELMQAVLARGQPFRFRAGGWSMAPFVRDGDTLCVAPLRRAPRVGDVVAFARPGRGGVVVHRVVGRCGAAYLLQGDGLPGDGDGAIPRACILGRVTRVERNGSAVRLGLGPERVLIALLSRYGLLHPLWRGAQRLRKGGA